MTLRIGASAQLSLQSLEEAGQMAAMGSLTTGRTWMCVDSDSAFGRHALSACMLSSLNTCRCQYGESGAAFGCAQAALWCPWCHTWVTMDPRWQAASSCSAFALAGQYDQDAASPLCL